jgi:formylglycine-generating enzyme required for sulfatase activity
LTQEHRHALPVGFEIESYRIDGILGFGGFGITYLATELALGRKVAIKEYLPTGLAARSPEDMAVRPVSQNDVKDFYWGLERFRQEAETLVNFHHPNIVGVHRFFEANGTAYLVMQFVDGQNLDQILTRTKTMAEAEVMRFVLPILDGLEEVHRAGFLHRDIKPANIYIRTDGTPILLDFSAARHTLKNEEMTAIVSDGYAPYEQYGSGGQLGPWTDIYGLGAVLYRCVTGQRPAQAPDRLAAVLNRQRDPLTPAAVTGRGRYADPILTAIDAAIRVFEKDRPQNIGALRQLFLAQPTMAAAATPAVQRAASRDLLRNSLEKSPAEGQGGAPKTPAAAAKRRQSALVIGAMVVIMIMVAAAGFLLGSRGGSNENRAGTRTGSVAPPEPGRTNHAEAPPPRSTTPGPETPPKPETASKPETPPAKPEAPAKPETPPGPETAAKPEAAPTPTDDPPASAAPRRDAQPKADCEGCPEMIAVAPGKGVFGSPDNEPGRENDEWAVREIQVEKLYLLARHETTRGQFEAFVKETNYKVEDGCFVWANGQWAMDRARNWRNPGFKQGDQEPVVCLGVKDAEAYAAWLSRKTGKQYRLPSEIEWEFAARAGTKESRYWSHDARDTCTHANGADETARTRHGDWTGVPCTDGVVYTAPVGSYRPNAFGLYDMIGNVSEWTADCWRTQPPQSASAATPTTGGDCTRRALRGGAFNHGARFLRSASRLKVAPNARIFNLGFRLARDAD